MNNSEGLKSFQQSLSGLPQWASERILQQINQLTHYEPVIGNMGKTGAGKSSLCNALFTSAVSPVSRYRKSVTLARNNNFIQEC